MNTVKQVSELTGISVRTLHYYDEIGLLKPSKVTDAGYRLYDENALLILQQILFFRELDFTLKDIRAIMLDPDYDKENALVAQRKLIQVKRDRLNRLLDLLDKLIKGEKCMSFKEFNMTEYTKALEEFITNNTDEILKYGGDLGEFQQVLKTLNSDNPEKIQLANMAIEQFGSIEKYTEEMKKNLTKFPELMEQMLSKKDEANSYIDQSDQLMKQLTIDLSKDVSSKDIQKIIDDLVNAGNIYTKDIELGTNYWGMVTDGYLSNPAIIEMTDKKYGSGASAYIGNALRIYWKL